MDSLLRTFQDVVDISRGGASDERGEEESGSGEDTGQPDSVESLRRRLRSTQSKLAAARETCRDLEAENNKLDADLVQQRLQFSNAFAIWCASLESQEASIQLLVDARGNAKSPARADSHEENPHVAALKEQVTVMRESLAAATQERDTARLQLKQQLERAAEDAGPSHASTAEGATGDGSAKESHSISELKRIWREEQESQEIQIASLTHSLQKTTNDMKKLLQGKQVHGLNIEKPAQSDATSAETEKSSSKKEADNVPERKADTPTANTEHDQLQTTLESMIVTKLKSEVQRLQGALEQSQQECKTWEDALSRMYEDNKDLEESSQRLRDELAIYKDEGGRVNDPDSSIKLQLADETEKNRALSAALETSQRTQTRLQHDIQSLQTLAQRLRDQLYATGSSVPGSPGRLAARTPDQGSPLLSDATSNFVENASKKLTAPSAGGGRREAAPGARGRPRILFVIGLALTLCIFISLSVGSTLATGKDGPRETVMEVVLRQQLLSCQENLKKAAAH